MGRFVFIYIIADRKLKEAIEQDVYQFGGALVSCVYGRGYYESRNLLDYLGFVAKCGKVIVTSLLERDKSLELIERLNTRYSFADKNSGIAFTVPVDKIVF